MPSLEPATVNKITLLIYKYYFIILFFAAGFNLCICTTCRWPINDETCRSSVCTVICK